ncbi:MAG: hypothetical protein MJ149_01730, partial [Clostridia bacterium]|nr:hypothetical protein [Clostridia bacterium]
MKVLILAYPGTGKSYLAEHYENVSDFEFQHYRYDYGKYKDLPLEQLKGREDIRTPKKDYPENFFKDLEKELELREIVCVPMATSIFPILDYLKSKDVRIIFAIRNEESFNDLINDYIKRGSTTEFIERRKH